MAKDVILAADLGGSLLSAEELAAIPDFAGIRKEIWDKFPGAIARKEYRAGEMLMREGENGTTAFYILSGTIESTHSEPGIAGGEPALERRRVAVRQPLQDHQLHERRSGSGRGGERGRARTSPSTRRWTCRWTIRSPRYTRAT